jgi:hypothetical protein
MKAIKTKMITMGLVSLFTIGLTQPSWSAGKGENPVELKVISNVDNAPLFQFKANNEVESEYTLKVKDANGVLLYSETLKGKNVLRKYKLDLSDADISDVLNVRFEVTNIQTKETFVYKISRNSRVVEDVIVAQL